MSRLEIVAAIAVVATLIVLFAIGRRFDAEGRNSQTRFTDADADGEPDPPAAAGDHGVRPPLEPDNTPTPPRAL